MSATKYSVQLRRSKIQLVTAQYHTSEVSACFPTLLQPVQPNSDIKPWIRYVFSHVIVDWHKMNSRARVKG